MICKKCKKEILFGTAVFVQCDTRQHYICGKCKTKLDEWFDNKPIKNNPKQLYRQKPFTYAQKLEYNDNNPPPETIDFNLPPSTEQMPSEWYNSITYGKEIDERLIALELHFQLVNQRLDDIEHQRLNHTCKQNYNTDIENTRAGITLIDSSLNSRIDDVENDMQKLQKQIKEIRNGYINVNEACCDDIKNIEDRISIHYNLINEISNFNDNINEIVEDIQITQKQINNLKYEIDPISGPPPLPPGEDDE